MCDPALAQRLQHLFASITKTHVPFPYVTRLTLHGLGNGIYTAPHPTCVLTCRWWYDVLRACPRVSTLEMHALSHLNYTRMFRAWKEEEDEEDEEQEEEEDAAMSSYIFPHLTTFVVSAVSSPLARTSHLFRSAPFCRRITSLHVSDCEDVPASFDTLGACCDACPCLTQLQVTIAAAQHIHVAASFVLMHVAVSTDTHIAVGSDGV